MSDDSPSSDSRNRTPAHAQHRQDRDHLAARLAAMPTVTTLIVAVSLIALPALVAVVETLGLALGTPTESALQCAVALAVLGVVVGVEDRSLESVGFRWPAWRDVAYLVGTAAAALALFILGAPLVEALGLPVADTADRAGPRPGLTVALFAAVSTGVVEEILYRGYPLERLLEYTDSALVAGTLTVVVFTLAHLVA